MSLDLTPLTQQVVAILDNIANGANPTAEEAALIGSAMEAIGGQASLLDVLAAATTEKTALSDLGTAQVAAINAQADAKVAQIMAAAPGLQIASAAILRSVQRYQNGFTDSITSQMVQVGSSSQSHVDRIWPTFLGLDTSYERQIIGEIHNQIMPFSNDARRVGWARYHQTHAQSSSEYNYPEIGFNILMLKNTTHADIVRSFDFAYTAYSSYSGACVIVVEPNVDNDNLASASGTTSTFIWGTTTAGSTTQASNITFPANKTVALMGVACPYYFSGPASWYQYRYQNYWRNLHTALGAGLEVDEVLTLRTFDGNHSSLHSPWLLAA